ncbi:hypothetical protein PHET_05510 [Paragonimus heterotremus]|uniref:Uncharacterized protein n=1 Tax=Paragonimus heterotremus TaxID=100268 RepID=A0A8J4WR86_9TREM|nr:hypothetical protein PHET_05510 [Paragonimus heterotremus]
MSAAFIDRHCKCFLKDEKSIFALSFLYHEDRTYPPERSSPPPIHSVRTLPVPMHLQNKNICTNEQRLEAGDALDNQTTTKQHTLSTLPDVHHLIDQPFSPTSHLESREAACKENGESQSTDLDSHVLTDKKVSPYCADRITEPHGTFTLL